ncbi:IS982 family transposase [Actinomyces sp.]|uniref:IS982 family transposase n=1 Tax=Actinomyces sp. TaxID=29317 RepID=UPI0026DAAF3E|nr:IS982 family transposase [Actinomyces sp.]MDO4901044.1 IS982 family transposase [Actinomyces sp.]
MTGSEKKWTPTWSLATALYVTVDDLLKAHPEITPPRPRVGICPRTSDAEIITLAVMQALLGHTSERRWLRHARKHYRGMFPHLPGQSGWNKRLRALTSTMSWVITALARATSIFDDTLWLADSTPIECARSRPTVRRSQMAGWAEYGYCASHSRYFWGLRLHLVATPHGLPIAWAVTGAKTDERDVLAGLLDHLEPHLHQVLAADKGYRSTDLETELTRAGITLLRPAARNESTRPGATALKKVRQVIESIFDTLKDQLDLERHKGRTPTGVAARITQRVLALTTAIWHNDLIGAPTLRSLTPYDH